MPPNDGAAAPTVVTPAAAAPPPGASASLNAPAPPPAPAAAPPPAVTPPGANGAPGGDWAASFDDDTKGYLQNKGFKSPKEVLDSYRNLEKTFGVPADQILKLPKDLNSPEARAVWERLGAPKTAAEYGIEKLVPKEAKEFADWASNIFHETGVPQSAAEKIVTKWNERAVAAEAASKENYIASITQGEAALKKEWGAAYEQNINLAKAGMRALELSNEEIDSLDRMVGRERLFKRLSAIGKGVGEASFVGGRPAADGALAPEQARQKIKELGQDTTWVKKFSAGDTEAKKLMEKLQRMAYPGEMTV